MGDTLFSVSGDAAAGETFAGVAPGSHWTDLLHLLPAPEANTLRTPLETLLRRGEAFTVYAKGPAGRDYRISGSTAGLRALVTFSPLSTGEAKLLANLERSEAARQRAERLVDAIAAAPAAMLQLDAAQQIVWATDAARSLGAQLADPEVLKRPTTAPVIAALQDGSGERHLSVTEMKLDDSGSRLLVVEDHSGTVTARRSLANFMATMTETFANMGTALAVFDGHQTLSLFNPCFTDLFGLDPAALAGRPTLRDLLEALRHARKLPEQADFTRWRDTFIREVTAARQMPVVQDWYLPGGEILRMTAQPHTGGSMVLLFEDISDHVSMERRYRIEIETGQSILDRLREGVAVFSSSGQVIYCNPAFAETLGFDPFRSLLSGGLQAFVDHAAGIFGQREEWQSFREFAVAADRPRDWVRHLPAADGGTLWLRANPLPDGSTVLVVTWGLEARPAGLAARAGSPVKNVGT